MDVPRKEAESLFHEVIVNLSSTNRDIRSSLRKCLLSCQILGWESQAERFRRELEGYPQDIEIPYYRNVSGILSWKPIGHPVDTIYWETSDEAFSPDLSPEPTNLVVFAPLDWIFSAAQNGYIEDTGEEKTVRFQKGRNSIVIKKYKNFASSAFGRILSSIENKIYNFAVRSYVQLKYGDLQIDIWEEYRTRAEQALSTMQLSQHLAGIQRGIESGNPEMLRTAVLGCRNLLHDIATFLWRDPRSTYTHLPGDGEDGKLQVTDDKYKNRLSAYIHQKSIQRKQRKSLSADLGYLAARISALISFQAEGHGDIKLDEARSIAIATYIVIGELAIWTDMEPINSYEAPTNLDDLLSES